MSTTTPRRTVVRTIRSVLVMAVMLLLLLSAAPAFAQQDPYVEVEPTVLPTLIEQPVTEDGKPVTEDGEDEVLGEVVERPGILPITGGDLTLFVATGAALIGTGVVVRRVRRREDN